MPCLRMASQLTQGDNTQQKGLEASVSFVSKSWLSQYRVSAVEKRMHAHQVRELPLLDTNDLMKDFVRVAKSYLRNPIGNWIEVERSNGT